MTTIQLKKESKAIKRVVSVYKNDKLKARKFLISIGLIDKNGKSKYLISKP